MERKKRKKRKHSFPSLDFREKDDKVFDANFENKHHVKESTNDDTNMESIVENELDNDDDDLPAAFSPLKKSVKEYKRGDVLFAKFQRYPYWPAVFFRYVQPRGRGKAMHAWVYFFEENSSEGKKVILKLPISRLRDFNCKERDDLIKIGKEFHPSSYCVGISQAEDYLLKRAVGKTKDFFAVVEENNIECTEECPSENVVKKCLNVPEKPELKSLTPKRKSTRQERLMNKELTEWIRRESKPLLLNIWKKKIKSFRHNTFMQGGQNEKKRLKFMSGFGPMGEEESEEVFGLLVDWFNCECKTSVVNAVTYVSEVWLPEAVINGLMVTKNLTRDAAEKEFLC